MQGAILEGVLDRDKREKKPPACLRVWLLWATCIPWAAQKAAKDGLEALGWLSQLNRRMFRTYATPSAGWPAPLPSDSYLRGQGRLGFGPALCG